MSSPAIKPSSVLFAAAGGTHDRDELAARNGKRQATQDFHTIRTVLNGLREVSNLKNLLRGGKTHDGR